MFVKFTSFIRICNMQNNNSVHYNSSFVHLLFICFKSDNALHYLLVLKELKITLRF